MTLTEHDLIWQQPCRRHCKNTNNWKRYHQTQTMTKQYVRIATLFLIFIVCLFVTNTETIPNLHVTGYSYSEFPKSGIGTTYSPLLLNHGSSSTVPKPKMSIALLLTAAVMRHKLESVSAAQVESTTTNNDQFDTTIELQTPSSDTYTDTNSNTDTDVDLSILQDVHVEIEGHTLGDNHRSESSSTSFFASIDKDGDGTLAFPELSKFLFDKIGGSAFDTQSECEDEAKHILQNLDLNHDDSLDFKDIFSYWKSLESLLTVDEVAEWIQYALQLPDYVVKSFRDNHVTGYDFPELVENNGESLLNELHIEKPKYRRKILRLVTASMLGIGKTPNEPSNLRLLVDGCSSLTLTWNKSQASDSFPVHSYRVQRKTIGFLGGNEKSQRTIMHHSKPDPNIDIAKSARPQVEDQNGKESHSLSLNYDPVVQHHLSTFHNNDLSFCTADTCRPLRPDWETVYVGSEPQYVDTTLEQGKDYIYRIQAWNAIGKSSWGSVDTKLPRKKMKCDKITTSSSQNHPSLNRNFTPPDEMNEIWYWSSVPMWILKAIWFVILSLKSIASLIFGFLAIVTTLMRHKRATATSTASQIDPICPQIFRFLRKISIAVLGVNIIPDYLTGETKTLNDDYDKHIKAVGLFGYNKSCKLAQKEILSNSDLHSSKYRDKRQIRQTSATDDVNRTPKMHNGRDGTLRKSLSADALLEIRSVQFQPASENSKMARRIKAQDTVTSNISNSTAATNPDDTSSTAKKKKNGLSKFLRRKRSLKTDFVSTSKTSILSELTTSHESEEGNRGLECSIIESCYSETEDDHKICNTCFKKYKFPKRICHHCSVCSATFCHQHGKITHSNITACKVSGHCICKKCLDDGYVPSSSSRSKSKKY